MIRAAGIFFLNKEGRALFLLRGPGSDHPGEWAFPGGQLEGNETPLEAALRETREEADINPPADRLTYLSQTVSPAVAPPGPVGGEPAVLEPTEQVCFTTFLCRISEEPAANLNYEHTAWCWAPITSPPQPLHPGCAVAIERLGMDELQVAQAIARGDLTSPQRFENITWFAMRITGTGRAYRASRKEWVWRDRSLYLNDHFLARCAGLPVVIEHPKKTMLDTTDYANRVVGAVSFAYIKDDEVWCLARINDQSAADLIIEAGESDQDNLSTSPAVVFRDASVNTKLTAEDGSIILVEGKPSLLDHLAICAQGVWDKGGAPAGISVQDAFGDSAVTPEEEAAAAADAAARKDAEEKAEKDRKDAAERRDAELCSKMDALMDAVGGMSARLDSLEQARGEPKQPMADAKKDGESEEEKTAREDAARRDADEKAEKERQDAAAREDAARRDAEERTRMDSLTTRLSDIERALPRSRTQEERIRLTEIQGRADRVFHMFNESAPAFLDGEDEATYRRRLLNGLKRHSKWAKVNIHAIADDSAFTEIEDQVYADAAMAANDPTLAGEGTLRAITENQGGHTFTRYVGDARNWMDRFSGPARQLVTGDFRVQ